MDIRQDQRHAVFLKCVVVPHECAEITHHLQEEASRLILAHDLSPSTSLAQVHFHLSSILCEIGNFYDAKIEFQHCLEHELRCRGVNTHLRPTPTSRWEIDG